MAGKRIVIPNYMPALDLNGFPLPGAKITFYENETTTLAAVYANEALTTPLTNPVVANLAGVFPSIFADEDLVFSVAITDADDNPIGGLRNKDEVRPSQIFGADSAAAENANAAAQTALAQILDLASGAPDAPSILNKADKDQNGADFANPEEVPENILFSDLGTGSEFVSVADYLRAMPIYAVAYGVVPDGTDKSSKMAAVVAQALSSGRRLVLPPGTIRLNSSTKVYLSEALTYQPAFRKGLRLSGAGSGRTIIDSRVANDFALDYSISNGSGGEHAFATYAGGLGGSIEGLTILNGAATAVSGGIRLRSQTQFTIRDVHIIGLSGTGFKIRCDLGDLDGSNQVLLEDVRIDDCALWGTDIGASAGHNEVSFTTLRRVFVQNCGTAEQKAITGITQANPGVVTCTGHGLTTGQRVFLAGVSGMTQVNSADAEKSYVATVINANSFSIGVDTSGFSAYTSGGFAFPRTPSSGGTRVKGQITVFQACGWTINKNRSVFIDGDGGGLPQDTSFENSTIENPQLIGFHDMGSRTTSANVLHLYSNQSISGGPNFWGHLYDGETNVLTDVNMNGLCVRATSAETAYTAFQVIGANADKNTINLHPENMHVKQFGNAGQTMFRGIEFEPVQQDCTVAVVSATTVTLRPDPFSGGGNKMPIRTVNGGSGGAAHLGAWRWVSIPTNGISVTNSGLANNTTYYPYLYADDIAVLTPKLELSTAVPVMDPSGHMVKTGDASRVWITDRTVRTDGSAQFVTTGGGWTDPLRLGGPQSGIPVWMFFNEADRSLNVKNLSTRPSSAADFTFKYKAVYEASKVHDFPSIAAGASSTFTMGSGEGVAGQLGDKVWGVSSSADIGGLILSGYFSGASTITVVAFNPTAGAIDPASATYYVDYARR